MNPKWTHDVSFQFNMDDKGAEFIVLHSIFRKKDVASSILAYFLNSWILSRPP